MKRLLTLFICIGAAWPMLSYAQIIDKGDQEANSWEIRESELETYEVKNEVLPSDLSLADEEIVTKKGIKFVLHGDAIDKEFQQRLQELSVEKQKNFHHIRLKLITRVAAILNSQRLTVGAAIASKNKIVGLFKKSNKAESALESKIGIESSGKKPTLQELGLMSVETILNNINHKFWSEAVNVANAKEVTVYLNPMSLAMLALPKIKAGFGIGAILGIGYTKATDVLFLEVLANIEKVKSGFGAMVAVKLLVGIEFNSNDKKAPLFKAQVSERYYPMLVPVWEGTGKGVYTAGTSLALSFPPAPISNPFYYRAEERKYPLIRLGINTLPMWTMVYRAFKRIHAPEALLLRFEKKARLGEFANSCPRLF